MSHPNTPSFPDFGKLVPGFDFLQNLAKQATGSATQALPQLPSIGSWIAPTLSVEELDKRVQELKAVQFWLDQNAAALKATIQALEVQKMTLATLKGMNFSMAEMANAFKIKPGDAASGASATSGSAQRASDGGGKNFPGLEIPPSTFQANKARSEAEAEPAPRPAAREEADASPAASVVDPMQWWGALTQQFQAIAAETMKEVAKTTSLDATKNLATGMAKDAVKTATDMATGLAKGMAETATKTMADGTRAAMSGALSGSWPKADADKPAAPGKAAAKKTGTARAARQPAPEAGDKAKPAAPARKAAARKTSR